MNFYINCRSSLVGDEDMEVVREVKVSAHDESKNEETVGKGQVSIISTYESG